MKNLLLIALLTFIVGGCKGDSNNDSATSSTSTSTTDSTNTTDFSGVYSGTTSTGSRTFVIYQVGGKFIGNVVGNTNGCRAFVDLSGVVSNSGSVTDLVKCNGVSTSGRGCSVSKETGTGTFSGNSVGSTFTFSYTNESGTLTKTSASVDTSACGNIEADFF